jgi:tetratricopeptide (TPR) repeat protein
MPIFRFAALAAVIAAAGACAPTAGAPPQPGQRIVLTDRQTGQRVETTYGELSALAAYAELRNRNYGRATAIATRALQSQSLTPKERSLNHTVRGLAHMSLRDAARARIDFDSAISADAGNHLAWTERGALNGAQRLYRLADLDRAISIKPTAFAHFERGRVKLLSRNLAGARADFDQAVALNPRFASAFFARGLTHHLAGQFPQARADYRQAIEINPNYEAPRQAMALLERRRAPAAGLQPGSRPGDVVQF